MGDKSVQKKKYIMQKARNVFCRNGYRAVTMKDIVEACDISRGGLYLYFSNTKELFEAVLAEEYAGEEAVLEKARAAHATPGEVMFQENVTALEKLIADGVEQEWMVCEDVAEAARNIAYTMEGLKISAQTIGVTAEAVDREIEYIMGTLGMVVK